MISDFGKNLSEGQRQRLALARVFARNASVLLLDEISSAVDPATREELLASIAEFARGKTVLFVSHQESCLPYNREIRLPWDAGADAGGDAGGAAPGPRSRDISLENPCIGKGKGEEESAQDGNEGHR